MRFVAQAHFACRLDNRVEAVLYPATGSSFPPLPEATINPAAGPSVRKCSRVFGHSATTSWRRVQSPSHCARAAQTLGDVDWRLPTVLRLGPYRFLFYSADHGEPRHVHVEREDSIAKFWLEPVRLEYSRGFGRSEIGRVERLVTANAADLVRAWHEYFGN